MSRTIFPVEQLTWRRMGEQVYRTHHPEVIAHRSSTKQENSMRPDSLEAAFGWGVATGALAVLGAATAMGAFEVVGESFQGNWGEWAGAAGSVAAVSVALWFSLRDQFRQERNQRAEARLLAWRLIEELSLTMQGLQRFDRVSTSMGIEAARSDVDSFRALRESLGNYGMPTAKSEFFRLTCLRQALGARIASTLALVDLVPRTLDRAGHLDSDYRRRPLVQAKRLSRIVYRQLRAIHESLAAIGNGKADPHAHPD